MPRNPADAPFHFHTKVSVESAHSHPKYCDYGCGACGKPTNGRVLCEANRPTKTILWCVCCCEKEEPTVLVKNREHKVVAQYPDLREFHPSANWPDELAKLYEEAARSFAAGAYTAAAMVSRKLLMAVACKEGDDDGKSFVAYVDYITNTVLAFPKAKDAISRIKKIGNDANHKVDFVERDQAHQAMSIVTFMLNTLYAFPTSHEAPAK